MCDRAGIAARGSAPTPRPRWGVLYAVVFLALTALALVDLVAPARARLPLDGTLAIAAIVAIALWIRGNRAALDQHSWCECAAETITVRVIPSRRLEAGERRVARRRGRAPERRELVPRDQW